MQINQHGALVDIRVQEERRLFGEHAIPTEF